MATGQSGSLEAVVKIDNVTKKPYILARYVVNLSLTVPKTILVHLKWMFFFLIMFINMNQLMRK